MVDQKKIAAIFNEFLGLYTGKSGAGIRALCEKYENHPMMIGLLSNLDAASEIPVPKAMKEIYAFYKEYRGRDLDDQEWKEITDRAGQMREDWQKNRWYTRVLLEVVNLLDTDDRERRKIAKEVEAEMEAAEQDAA